MVEGIVVFGLGVAAGWAMSLFTIDFALKRKDIREPYQVHDNTSTRRDKPSDELLIAMGETYFREDYVDDDEEE